MAIAFTPTYPRRHPSTPAACPQPWTLATTRPRSRPSPSPSSRGSRRHRSCSASGRRPSSWRTRRSAPRRRATCRETLPSPRSQASCSASPSSSACCRMASGCEAAMGAARIRCRLLPGSIGYAFCFRNGLACLPLTACLGCPQSLAFPCPTLAFLTHSHCGMYKTSRLLTLFI